MGNKLTALKTDKQKMAHYQAVAEKASRFHCSGESHPGSAPFYLGGGMNALFIVLTVVILLSVVFCWCAFASNKTVAIDMEAIKQIESGGNPKAENRRSGALGLYQITGICLKDFNQQNGMNYSRIELLNPVINESVARWYFFVRIPQLLRYYKKTVTLERVLLAYNAGIHWAIKDEYPQETINYIKKYKQIAREK